MIDLPVLQESFRHFTDITLKPILERFIIHPEQSLFEKSNPSIHSKTENNYPKNSCFQLTKPLKI